MSAAPTDRIKLSTGATTIIRAPISRTKSRNGDGAFSAALPGPSRDKAGEVTDSAHVYDGIKPPRPPGPLGPRHDALTANHAISLRAAEPVSVPVRDTHPLSSVAAAALGRGPSTRRLSLAPAPAAAGKPSTLSASGAAPSGFGAQGPGGGGGGVSFRRPGVTSAPVAFCGNGGGGAAAGARSGSCAQDGHLLPAIKSGSMCPKSSANQPGSSSSAPSRSPDRQPSRSFVSLPSLGGAVVGEDTPVVVSFAPSRGTSKKAMLSGVSRAGRSLTGAALASAAAAEVEDDDDGGTAPPAASDAGGGTHGRLSKVSMNGGSGDVGGGPPAAASPRRNPQDDTVRQDDKASAMAPSALSSCPPAAASAVLLASHQRERERVNRVRSALLGAAPDGVVRIAEEARSVSGHFQSTQVMPPGASAAARGGGVDRSAAVSGPAVSEPMDEDVGELMERGLRSSKSFTQRALEDPNSPMFKTAKQLVKLQEQLSYMETKDWREKAAVTVPMERPILMAEGWKI